MRVKDESMPLREWLSFIPKCVQKEIGEEAVGERARIDAWRRPLGGSRTILAHLGGVSRAQWLLVLTSCLTAGVVGSSLQFEAQKVLPAASMQPFFALQPIFACAWTRLFLAEPVAPAMLGGGTLMVVGALLASTDARTVAE